MHISSAYDCTFYFIYCNYCINDNCLNMCFYILSDYVHACYKTGHTCKIANTVFAMCIKYV